MQDSPVVETRFELRGEELGVDYSPTQLTVRDAEGEKYFAGGEVETEPTSIGTLLTVTLEAIPDGDTKTLTLLLPEVNFPPDISESAVTAVAIRTFHAGSIGGPQLVQGPLQGYTVLPLAGTATWADNGGLAECRSWGAWHNLEPPSPGRIIVTAECTVPSPGHRVSLVRHEPPGINPRDLLLDRVVRAPAEPAAQVQTTVAARYEEETDAEYDTVTILPGWTLHPGGEGLVGPRVIGGEPSQGHCGSAVSATRLELARSGSSRSPI